MGVWWGVRGNEQLTVDMAPYVGRAGEASFHVPWGKVANSLPAGSWALGDLSVGWIPVPAPHLLTPSPPAGPQRLKAILGFF